MSAPVVRDWPVAPALPVDSPVAVRFDADGKPWPPGSTLPTDFPDSMLADLRERVESLRKPQPPAPYPARGVMVYEQFGYDCGWNDALAALIETLHHRDPTEGNDHD